MQIVRTTDDLRRALTSRRDVTLVPTMGNLHEGHLSLVRIARARAGPVVASVFVNRLQFAPHEDFVRYPRTFDRDCELLEGAACDIVFAPAEEEIYPEPQEYTVDPPGRLADILEGEVRPGFFIGVCTVVLKLFNLVQPAAAVFGKKDYQQLLVIQSMVRQLALPIDILPAETIRDGSGVALSSRNGYLNDRQLIQAAELNVVLGDVAAALRSGRTDWAALEQQAAQVLTARGWRPDYVAIRGADDLGEPRSGDRLVVLGAANLGGTRLIDNLAVDR